MIKIQTLFKIAARNIIRNKKRTIFTIFAISAGIVSTSLLSSIQVGSRKQIEDDAILNLLGHITLSSKEYSVEQSASNSIKDFSIDLSSPDDKVVKRIKIFALIMSERKSKYISFVGIDPSTEKGLSVLDQNSYLSRGQSVESPDEPGIVIGERTLADLDTDIGKRIVLLAQDRNGKVIERGFRVKGTYRSELGATEGAYAVTGIKTAQRILGLEGYLSNISITLGKERNLEEVVKELKQQYPNLDIKTWIEAEPFLQAVVKLQNGVLLLWYGVVLFAIFLGVLNTLYMMVSEREKEFCLYRAMGLGNSYLILEILLEMLMLISLSVLFGILISYCLITILSSYGIPLHVFSSGAAFIGLRSTLFPIWSLEKVMGFAVLIIVSTLVGSYVPTRNAVKVRAIEGLAR